MLTNITTGMFAGKQTDLGPMFRKEALQNRIKELGADFDANGKQFRSEEQRSEWDALNAEYDSMNRTLQHGIRAQFNSGSSSRNANENVDNALAGWARNASGIAITGEDEDACRSYGVSLNSSTFSARMGNAGISYGFGEHRSYNEKTTNNLGGYTVPQGFFTSLERAMLDFAGVLNVCEIIRTPDGCTMPWPTSDDTGNSGEMIAESTAVAEQTIAFAAVNFLAYKASSKLVRVSTELLRDNAILLASSLGQILGERLGRIMATKLTTGTGSGEPQGIVTAATLGKTCASATAITMDELVDLSYSVDPAYRSDVQNTGFMLHDSVAKYVRKLKDANGQYLWQSGSQVGQPATLLGWPVCINNAMSSAITTGQKTVLFGAMKKFKVRIVNDVRIRRMDERFAEFDQSGFLGFVEFDSHLLDAGTHPVKYMAQA